LNAGNLDVVRRGFQAMREGGVEALLPLIHPNFEMTTPAALSAEPDTYRGPEGMRRYFASFLDAMDEITFEAHEMRAVGELVVVPVTLRARGRTTGIETEQEVVLVWEVRNGKAYRVEVFATLEEAMAAAGARTEGGSASGMA
jgi:ketosteroid isomerase-like protein